MKFTIDAKLKGGTGSEVPLKCKVNGEWQEVGTGVYDSESGLIEVDFDPNTPNGEHIINALGMKSVGEFSIFNKEDQNG